MAEVPATRASFTVAVRCRRLNAHEMCDAAQRYHRRRDTHYHCVLLSHTAPSQRAGSVLMHAFSNVAADACVVLVDPDADTDFSPLWHGCTPATPAGDSLLLQLGAQDLRNVLSNRSVARCFLFDKVFPPASTNVEIYTDLVQRLVVGAENGYNGTFFAYGQTGTGKSYTAFGDPSADGVPGLCSLVAADLLGHRGFPQCLSSIDTVTGDHNASRLPQRGKSVVFVSFLELYNEKLRDLLVSVETNAVSSGAGARNRVSEEPHCIPAFCVNYKDLNIVENPVHGVQVPHLTTVRVHSVEALERLLEDGSRRRTKAPTNGNEVSSRSHAIVQFTVKRRLVGDDVVGAAATRSIAVERIGEAERLMRPFLSAKLSIVDLAGSERVDRLEVFTTAEPAGGSITSGVCAMQRQQDCRRREGSMINRSLLALGNCIKAVEGMCRDQRRKQQLACSVVGAPLLSSHSLHSSVGRTSTGSMSHTKLFDAHVPYRDSKLTRLLKDSLGGNTQTVMLATISPSCTSFEETLSTLKYAARARGITRYLHRNVFSGDAQEEEEEVEEKLERMTDTRREACGNVVGCTGRGLGTDSEADRRLILLKLEAEVRSLQTQLQVTRAATVKMGLPGSVDASKGAAPSTTTPTTAAAALAVGCGDGGVGDDRCWELYKETRRELQALLQERRASYASAGDDVEGYRAPSNRELIRELVRQERRNALLKEHHKRMDAFLL